jgi:hypothetical protein
MTVKSQRQNVVVGNILIVTPALWQVSEKEETAAAWLLVVHDA